MNPYFVYSNFRIKDYRLKESTNYNIPFLDIIHFNLNKIRIITNCQQKV